MLLQRLIRAESTRAVMAVRAVPTVRPTTVTAPNITTVRDVKVSFIRMFKRFSNK